jgi:hypothetical protein
VLGAAVVTHRFSQVQLRCASGLPDITPYGVDSVFKLGSLNFNADLYDPDGKLRGWMHARCGSHPISWQPCVRHLSPLAGHMMTSVYNCSQLPAATYNTREASTKLVTNPPPLCAELFNPRLVWRDWG